MLPRVGPGGGLLEEFVDPVQPRSSFTWNRAEVTDDTRMALITAGSLIETGGVDPGDIVARVLKEPVKGWPGWEKFRTCWRAGSYRFSPGSGAPGCSIAIGTVYPTGDLEGLVGAVDRVVRPTHDTLSAVAGSAAVAAACSALLEGMGALESLTVAIRAATLAGGGD